MKVFKNLFIISILIALSLSIIPSSLTNAESGANFKQRNATLENFSGRIKIRKAGTGRWIEAQKGMLLTEQDTVKAYRGASAEVLIPLNGKVSTVQVYENTELTIGELVKNTVTGEGKTVLDVSIGKVLIKAAKLEGEDKFEVVTPTSVVGVRGTEFEVTVSAVE